MCVAIPGEVIEIKKDSDFLHGVVSFGGIKKDISLVCTPEVELGDYVLVHVGLAISIVDKDEAARIYRYLEEINEIDEVAGKG